MKLNLIWGEAAWSALTRSFGENPTSEQVLERNRLLFGERLTPAEVVKRIVQDIRVNGDEAVTRYAQLLDGVPSAGIRVPQDALFQARDALDPKLLGALRHAIARLRAFYEAQPAHGFLQHTPEGALGQLVRPVGRVGVYVPAGAAPLPSSLLHTAIPAQVAGVPEIIVCSPPGQDGRVDQTTLAAAAELGVNAVFALGGAVAVAAMAFGTQSVPRVDKIGGPGNVFTVLAMREVFGAVGIVSLPGPTETLVLADEGANPRLAAADLLAQAEHVNAQPVLVTTSKVFFERLQGELERQVNELPEPNRSWAADSLIARGVYCLAADIPEAMRLANHYAPEHLCLLVSDPWSVLGLVENAGGVFVGEQSMEALGDYLAGPSHVMPTGGTARFSSPVNVRDFQKIISVVGLTRYGLENIADDGARLARAEGLEAHARAIEARLLR